MVMVVLEYQLVKTIWFNWKVSSLGLLSLDWELIVVTVVTIQLLADEYND